MVAFPLSVPVPVTTRPLWSYDSLLSLAVGMRTVVAAAVVTTTPVCVPMPSPGFDFLSTVTLVIFDVQQKPGPAQAPFTNVVATALQLSAISVRRSSKSRLLRTSDVLRRENERHSVAAASPAKTAHSLATSVPAVAGPLVAFTLYDPFAPST